MATAAKKPAAKKAVTPAKAPTKSAPKGSPQKVTATGTVARKPNATFIKPLTPSATLSAIVDATPLPRNEVTKKVWEYIKKHNLQNPANKCSILAEEKLKVIFGGKKRSVDI